jgi:hypothetical protein
MSYVIAAYGASAALYLGYLAYLHGQARDPERGRRGRAR